MVGHENLRIYEDLSDFITGWTTNLESKNLYLDNGSQVYFKNNNKMYTLIK